MESPPHPSQGHRSQSRRLQAVTPNPQPESPSAHRVLFPEPRKHSGTAGASESSPSLTPATLSEPQGSCLLCKVPSRPPVPPASRGSCPGPAPGLSLDLQLPHLCLLHISLRKRSHLSHPGGESNPDLSPLPTASSLFPFTANVLAPPQLDGLTSITPPGGSVPQTLSPLSVPATWAPPLGPHSLRGQTPGSQP